ALLCPIAQRPDEFPCELLGGDPYRPGSLVRSPNHEGAFLGSGFARSFGAGVFDYCLCLCRHDQLQGVQPPLPRQRGHWHPIRCARRKNSLPSVCSFLIPVPVPGSDPLDLLAQHAARNALTTSPCPLPGLRGLEIASFPPALGFATTCRSCVSR